MRNEQSDRTVSLPDRIHSRIDQRVSQTQFESVEEYVVFALEEVLAEVETRDAKAQEEVDDAEVRSRLESLGYLQE